MKAVNVRRKKRPEAGVTLIEMIVVVTIIALFAVLVAPGMFKQADKARATSTRVQIDNFMTAIGSYKLDTSVFPTTEQGLQVLRTNPGSLVNWNGPYLPKDVPNDSWGHPFVYKYPGDHGDEPDIISYGADGQPGGDGVNADIVSWSNK